MKPMFHHGLVNGPFDDPCLFVRLMWEKRALMFDLGTVTRLRSADLLKLTDIFVTHTHIDHFIGFDTVLRALLMRERTLRIYGPPNIIDCVEGKLNGYTWNLIRDYPIRLEAIAVGEQTITRAGFYAHESFRRTELGSEPFNGVLLDEPEFKVRAVHLEHDIPSLAYSLEEDIHINIDKAALDEMGLPVGPWLADLKKAIRRGMPDDTAFGIDGRELKLSELREHLVIHTKGQKIAYVADASPSRENIQKIKDIATGSDTLYCEAYFLDEDIDRARERNHLTAGMAGRTARDAGVKNLVVMHFSPKYRGMDYTPLEEAAGEFSRKM